MRLKAGFEVYGWRFEKVPAVESLVSLAVSLIGDEDGNVEV